MREKYHCQLSIPWGSIKSFMKFMYMVNILFLSIPWGSIKSRQAQKDKYEFLNFQFLEVQLKVQKSMREKYHCQLSIPWGSIKRDLSTSLFLCSASFQFLEVQLKVIDALAQNYVFSIFQFLEVQLKAGEKAWCDFLSATFNSLRFN